MISNRYNNDGKPSVPMNDLQIEMKNKIEEKLYNRLYKTETVPCVICNKTIFEKIAEKDRYGFNYRVCICSNCGLVQTMPRMTKESYEQLYNYEYHKLNKGKDVPNKEYFEFQYNRGREIYDYFKSQNYIINNKNVLEIGCGSGGILKYFQEKENQVIGVDLSSDRIDYGREEHDLELYNIPLKDYKTNITLDLIIMSHVVEHFTDPLEELKILSEFVNKNTLILILLPGIKNIEQSYDGNLLKYFQLPHTYHFSFNTITNLMNKAGYQLICGNEEIYSIFSYCPDQHEQSISNDYESIICFLEEIENRLWK
tara:strand:+ start:1259 stop:2194 length:936 start_codon:yes stop_codon:yes gene_type:complete